MFVLSTVVRIFMSFDLFINPILIAVNKVIMWQECAGFYFL